MANKIYVPETQWTSALNSRTVSKEYDEKISIIAKCLSQLKEVENRFEYLSEKTCDNADPQLDLSEAIRALGEALASAVCYRDEYLKEANDTEEEDNEE